MSYVPVTPYLEVSFTTSTVQAVGTTDVSSYAAVSVQITSQGGSSTITFQGSNDNTNWVSVALLPSTAVGSTVPAVSSTTTGIWSGPVPFRYFRLNVTGIVSGTTAGVIEFLADPSPQLTSQHAVTVTSSTALTPGTAATNLGKAEDAASASGDTGVFALSIRRDGVISASPTSNAADYQEIASDNYGQLRIAVQGRTTNPTASGDAQGVILLSDKLGKIITVPAIRDLKNVQQTTITTSGTETTIVTAGAAGVFQDLYRLTVGNTSAVPVVVRIKDATSGTTRFRVPIPAFTTVTVVNAEAGSAVKQAAAANNWTLTPENTAVSLEVTAEYVSNI